MNDDLEEKILEVPLVEQKTPYLCSEDSAQMILDYFKKEYPKPFQETFDNIGCSALEIMDECLDPFLKCSLKNAEDIEEIKKEIKNNRPIVARIVPDFQTDRHSIVIVGFSGNNVIANDPAYSIPRILSTGSFLRQWNKTNKLYLICEEKETI